MIYQRICIIKQRRKYNSALGPKRKLRTYYIDVLILTFTISKMVTDEVNLGDGNKTQEERVYLSPTKDLCTDEIVSV